MYIDYTIHMYIYIFICMYRSYTIYIYIYIHTYISIFMLFFIHKLVDPSVFSRPGCHPDAPQRQLSRPAPDDATPVVWQGAAGRDTRSSRRTWGNDGKIILGICIYTCIYIYIYIGKGGFRPWGFGGFQSHQNYPLVMTNSLLWKMAI